MIDWNFLNKARVSDPSFGPYASTPSDGFNGFFCFRLNGLPVKCIVSDGSGWQHVSVSIEGSTQPPSWSIMCQVKDLFWEPEDWVAQFHPAQSEYVNNHPGVLHLWKCLDKEFPKPDRLMVGFKDQSDIDRVNNDPRSAIKIV